MANSITDRIVPTPRQIFAGDGTLSFQIVGLRLQLPAGQQQALAYSRQCVENLLGQPLRDSDVGGPAVAIRIAGASEADSSAVPDHPEGYTLQVSEAGIRIVGQNAAGCYCATQTLRQIAKVENGRLTCPSITIVDWPDYAHRGLFIEDFWGTDRMSLDDYRALLDQCAALKFNTMAIGIFGGWEIKHHGRLTEFLMAPLRRHPEMKTPQLVRYIDPETRRPVELNYLPRMYEEDYLSQVIQVANERHIKVIPLWGGPAHVTLIPRLHPEISARDGEGKLTHYGYCMSEPATWELLFDILDEIAETYLLPNGLDTMQLACDEIYPIRSVYEDDPLAEVDPWCRCPQCAQLSEAELLTKYVVELAGRLKTKGIKTFIWQDTFERLDAMDVLWNGLKTAGLESDVTMGWWAYKEPLPDLSKFLPIPNWVQPSTGILASIFYQDFSRNIYGMLRRGMEAGAVGATAYNVPDPAQHKNYECLSEFAWNGDGLGSIPHFHIKYAQTHFGPAWREALEAYDVAERVFGSYPLIVYTLDQLIYYFNSYPFGTRGYPVNVLTSVAADPLALKEALRQSVAHLETARQLIERCRPHDRDNLIPLFIHECDRVTSVVELVLGIVHALAEYSAARDIFATDPTGAHSQMTACRNVVSNALEEMLRVMREMKLVKPAYLWPATWQELSYLVAFAGDLLERFSEIETQARAGQLAKLPLLPIMEQIGERALRAAWHPWEF